MVCLPVPPLRRGLRGLRARGYIISFPACSASQEQDSAAVAAVGPGAVGPAAERRAPVEPESAEPVVAVAVVVSRPRG